MTEGRDPRTKTDWSRTERFGPGPCPPDRTRTWKNTNLGPDRTRTDKILEIQDELGPGPNK